MSAKKTAAHTLGSWRICKPTIAHRLRNLNEQREGLAAEIARVDAMLTDTEGDL